jgi:hypothetical protein
MGFRGFLDGLNLEQIASQAGTPETMPPDLQSHGILGTAVVRSMESTGVGSGAGFNASHVLIFELSVSLPGQASYVLKTNQSLPNMLTGTVLPSSIVFVRADPSNLSRVAIDFIQAVPGAGEIAAAGIAGAATMGVIVPGAPLVPHDELLATGIDASGTVELTFGVGDLMAPTGDPILGIMMGITRPGHSLYFSKSGQPIPRDRYSLVVPGAMFPLKVDPSVPGLWAIDWADVPMPTV